MKFRERKEGEAMDPSVAYEPRVRGETGRDVGEETTDPKMTVADVARALRWSEATVHRHSCPIAEWKRERGLVPLIRLGGRDYVPRWWLEETIRALTVAPK